MKDATPSDKRKSLAIEKICGLETERIAEKYRKLGGIQGQDFGYLIDENDWTSIELRNDFVEEIITGKKELRKAFDGFRKALSRKYPEYTYLVLREDWKPVIGELFLFGGIQYDTVVPFGNVSWIENSSQEKALHIKILPGADRQQIIDFLNKPENNIEKRFKKINITVPKVKSRTGKSTTYELDLWVRVLDIFTSEEIRDVFALRFPEKYRDEFTLNGNRKNLIRAKYELIAHYVFHRFGLSAKNGKFYKADYIKTIVEKSNKDKTKLKRGVISKIP